MSFRKLTPPDSVYLSIARGWFELGDYGEARKELRRITPEFQKHPDVLKLRWQICAKTRHWKTCFKIADELMEAAPDDPQSWFCRAYARIVQSHMEDSQHLPV